MLRSDALALLLDIARGHMRDDVWVDAPLESVKRLPPTAIGASGEDYAYRLCGETGLSEDVRRKRGGEPWDLWIEGRAFEIKTATQGERGRFQFNNIRVRQRYDALLAIAIAPDDVFVQAWTGAGIKRGDAGHLSLMDRDAPNLLKITRQARDLRPVTEFRDVMRGALNELDMDATIDPGPKPAPRSPGLSA